MAAAQVACPWLTSGCRLCRTLNTASRGDGRPESHTPMLTVPDRSISDDPDGLADTAHVILRSAPRVVAGHAAMSLAGDAAALGGRPGRTAWAVSTLTAPQCL
jgi:hypothetical protein